MNEELRPFALIQKNGQDLTNEELSDAYLIVFYVHLRAVLGRLILQRPNRSALVATLPTYFSEAMLDTKIVDNVNCEIDETPYWNNSHETPTLDDPMFMYLSFRPHHSLIDFGYKFKVSFNKNEARLNIDRFS